MPNKEKLLKILLSVAAICIVGLAFNNLFIEETNITTISYISDDLNIGLTILAFGFAFTYAYLNQDKRFSKPFIWLCTTLSFPRSKVMALIYGVVSIVVGSLVIIKAI